MKSAKQIVNEDLLTLKFCKEILNQNAMKSIRGGDGEANGGIDIIIIPKLR